LGADPHDRAESAPPSGVALFAADNSIRRLIDPANEIEHGSEFDRGGHFAVMEAHDLLTGDVRTFFRRCE